MPPSGAQIMEYWARPTASAGGSLTSALARAGPASGPSTKSSPMCDRSNRPARSRTARCSSRMLAVLDGHQPAAELDELRPEGRVAGRERALANGRSSGRSRRTASDGRSSAGRGRRLGAEALRRRRSRPARPGSPRGARPPGRRARAPSRRSGSRAPRRARSSGPRRTRGRGATGRRRWAPSGSSGRSCGCACRAGRTCRRSSRAGRGCGPSSPVSSATSRMAVSSVVSPASGVPLGSVQVPLIRVAGGRPRNAGSLQS